MLIYNLLYIGIHMINIGILGNAVDYGELSVSRGYSGDVSGD